MLLFEDDDGGAHTINTTTLKQMFCEHALHNSVKLLVLMACDTDRIAQALSTSTVESVIGTKGKVSDAVAAYFTEHLYLALASRAHSLTKAFAMAQEIIRASPDFHSSDADRFVLYIKGLSSEVRNENMAHVTDMRETDRGCNEVFRMPLPIKNIQNFSLSQYARYRLWVRILSAGRSTCTVSCGVSRVAAL